MDHPAPPFLTVSSHAALASPAATWRAVMGKNAAVPVATTRSLFSPAKEAAIKQSTRRRIPELVYGLVTAPDVSGACTGIERGGVSLVSSARMPELESQGSFAPPLLPHASVFLLVQTLCPLAPFAEDAIRPCAADSDDVPHEGTHAATEEARAVVQVPQAPAARPTSAGAAGEAVAAQIAAPHETHEFQCITSESTPHFAALSGSNSVAMMMESGRAARGRIGGSALNRCPAAELPSGTEVTLPAHSTLVDWSSSSGPISARVARNCEAEHEQPVQKHLPTPSFRSRSGRQRILRGSDASSPRTYPRNLTPLSGGPPTARSITGTSDLASPGSLVHHEDEPLCHAAALLSLPRLHPYNSASLESPSSRFMLPRFVRPKIPETVVPGAADGNGSAPVVQVLDLQLAESLSALERWVEGARDSIDVTTHELHEESDFCRGPTENPADTADMLHESVTAEALHYSPRLVSGVDTEPEPQPPRASTGIVSPVIGCTPGRPDTLVTQAQWEANMVPPFEEANTSDEAAHQPVVAGDDITATESVATAFLSRDTMDDPARIASALEASPAPAEIATQYFDVQARSPSPPAEAPDAIEEIVRQILGASSDQWLSTPATHCDSRVPTATVYRTAAILPVSRSFIRIAPLSTRGHGCYPTDEGTGARHVECDDAGASHTKPLACSGLNAAIPSEEHSEVDLRIQHSPVPAAATARGPLRGLSSLPRVVSSRIAVSRSSVAPQFSAATTARAAAQRSTALARSLQLRVAAGSFTGRSVDHLARTAYQSFLTHKCDAQ